MAKGKGKKSSSGGPHKNHGPKKHLFKEYKPIIKAMADAGLLSKYYNYDSFSSACSSKGKRNPSKHDFNDFFVLSKEDKKGYFKGLRK